MPKFMNAELRAIRDSLHCGHCSAVFQGSDSQAWHVKYEAQTVYCSPTCKAAAMREKLSTPIPNRGPCPTCSKTFFSRRAKVYCSLGCYVASDQFLANVRAAGKAASASLQVRAKISKKLRTGATKKCLECGDEFYCRPSVKRKFCAKSCYRTYMAKRFDRWIANPERLALPQCYDEFLDREELPCLVDGCTWQGKHLTLHINQAHGVRGDEFKRAAGFNLSTGVVAKPLAEALQQRSLHGVAVEQDDGTRLAWLTLAHEQQSGGGIRYRSTESLEHYRKARAMLYAEHGPLRICAGCGQEFQQRFTMGRALYCTVECRDRTYRERARRA